MVTELTYAARIRLVLVPTLEAVMVTLHMRQRRQLGRFPVKQCDHGLAK